MRTCDICGCGLIGERERGRCHRCEAALARALVARMMASSPAYTDFGRGVIHSPRHEEPGRPGGPVSEAEAIIRARWPGRGGGGDDDGPGDGGKVGG